MTPAVNSGGTTLCTGVFSIDLDDFAHGGLGGSPVPELLVPGSVIWCQWHRNDPGFPPPNNTTLTDGLEFTVGS